MSLDEHLKRLFHVADESPYELLQLLPRRVQASSGSDLAFQTQLMSLMSHEGQHYTYQSQLRFTSTSRSQSYSKPVSRVYYQTSLSRHWSTPVTCACKRMYVTKSVQQVIQRARPLDRSGISNSNAASNMTYMGVNLHRYSTEQFLVIQILRSKQRTSFSLSRSTQPYGLLPTGLCSCPCRCLCRSRPGGAQTSDCWGISA